MQSRIPSKSSQRRSLRHTPFLAALAAGCMVLALPRAEAQITTAFWVGSAGPNWNAVNWNTTSSTTANYTPANGNALRWGPASTQSLTSNNDFTDLSVTTVSLQNAPANIVLGGNRLTVTTSGSSVFDANNAVNATINLPVRSGASSGGTLGFTVFGGSLTLNGVISETNANTIVHLAPNTINGTFNVNGLNTFTGVARVGSGGTATVNFSTLANKTSPQALGQGNIEFGYASGTNMGGAILNYSGGATTTDKGFRIGRDLSTFNSDPGVAFNNNGTGAVVWTGSQLVSSGIGTNMAFNLGGTNADDNDWQSVIANNAATRLVGITKNGAGKWILSGNNTYDGATTVSAGTLLVNGDQSGALGAVSVAAGAILGGTGTIGGVSAAVSGTVAPGLSDALGTLSFANTAIDFATDGSLLAGLDASFSSDVLAISGTGSLTLGGTSILDLTGPGSFTSAGTYTLATFPSGSRTSEFTTVKYNGTTYANPTTSGGINSGGTLVYNADSIQLVVVPEPGTLALAGLGMSLAGVLARRRRR